MAEPQALEARIGQVEAALARAVAALRALGEVPDLRPELAEARAALEAAEARIAALEGEAERAAEAMREAEARAGRAETAAGEAEARYASGEVDRLRDAVEALAAHNARMREEGGAHVDAGLRAEIEGLRAARAMDLREMKLLLAELEPALGAGDRPGQHPGQERADA
jgi:chromosome segregation ATPase